MGFKQKTMGFKQNMMGFKQNMMFFLTKYDGVYTVLYIIDHFEWFFMEILTALSCSLYQYVGLWDINLPMHLRL
jgi:hypothetical protein